jgi:hypothetical protein
LFKSQHKTETGAVWMWETLCSALTRWPLRLPVPRWYFLMCFIWNSFLNSHQNSWIFHYIIKMSMNVKVTCTGSYLGYNLVTWDISHLSLTSYYIMNPAQRPFGHYERDKWKCLNICSGSLGFMKKSKFAHDQVSIHKKSYD